MQCANRRVQVCRLVRRNESDINIHNERHVVEIDEILLCDPRLRIIESPNEPRANSRSDFRAMSLRAQVIHGVGTRNTRGAHDVARPSARIPDGPDHIGRYHAPNTCL